MRNSVDHILYASADLSIHCILYFDTIVSIHLVGIKEQAIRRDIVASIERKEHDDRDDVAFDGVDDIRYIFFVTWYHHCLIDHIELLHGGDLHGKHLQSDDDECRRSNSLDRIVVIVKEIVCSRCMEGVSVMS